MTAHHMQAKSMLIGKQTENYLGLKTGMQLLWNNFNLSSYKNINVFNENLQEQCTNGITWKWKLINIGFYYSVSSDNATY